MRRPSLLITFGAFSLVPMMALGFVIADRNRAVVEERTIANLRGYAMVATRLISQFLVPPDAYAAPLSPTHVELLDKAAGASGGDGVIAHASVWNRNRTVIYAQDHRLIGTTLPASGARTRATHGELPTQVMLGGKDPAARGVRGRWVQLLIPLRYGAHQQILGVAEVYTPYAPIARDVAAHTRATQTVLAVGPGVLWLLLFSLVAVASRQLRRRATENHHLARHDPLTGLPNRVGLSELLDRVVDHSVHRSDGTFTLALLDLDRFQDVNDSLGHEVGDRVLQLVAHRIRQALPTSTPLARLGGDEFAFVLPGCEQTATRSTVEAVLEALEQPAVIEAARVGLRASIGTACFPTHGSDGSILLQRADIALHAAKRRGIAVTTYTSEDDPTSPAQLALLADLRTAITERAITLVFQPVVDLADGSNVSLEALARWHHHVHGHIPPDQFVQLAERSGLVRELTREVLRQAFEQAAVWRGAGIDLPVAVNLSASDLRDGGSLVATVLGLLAHHDVPPQSLIVEVTETAVLADVECARATLQELYRRGVGVALDDFGTGYSSLSHLRDLPITELKIDRSFIARLASDERSATIVGGVVALGRQLGVTVVAEGVESAEDAARLTRLGCPQAQGYHFSRPQPAADITALLRRRADTPDPAAVSTSVATDDEALDPA